MNSILTTSLLLAASFWFSARAETFRTDINPALLYWQAAGEWPSPSETDHGYISTNDWRGRDLDERFSRLMAAYDNSFKLIRRAAKSKVKCDWGYDLSDGPEALLPGLAKAKAAAQMARLRTPWHLQRGNQAAARDELLATFTLGRNLSTDGVLISALVQIAIENIVTAAIAENFYAFQPETLKQISAGLESAPRRGTIAECIPVERYSFSGWLLRKLEEFNSSSGGDEKVVSWMRDLIQKSLSTEEKPDPTVGDRVIKAAGGTSAGLVRYINELTPLYDEADVLMTLPYGEFVPRIKAFNEKVEKHSNLLVHMFLPIFEKCRNKEFAAQVNLAMLQAGIEYRLSGDTALQRVQDPIYKEPFGFSRLSVDGINRGFKLSSRFTGRDFEEVLVFIEKGGAPLQVIGKNAGKKAQ